jgi:hypothetical protein
MALDPSGNLYDTGSFAGTIDFNPGPGTFQLSSAGASDIFIAKTDSAGQFLWARSIGSGTGFGRGAGIAADGTGDVYATGVFSGTVDFNPGSRTSDLTASGDSGSFVVKLNRAGGFVWAAKIDGPSDDRGVAIAVDETRNVHTAGVFRRRADFAPGAEIFRLSTRNRSADVFVTRWAQP